MTDYDAMTLIAVALGLVILGLRCLLGWRTASGERGRDRAAASQLVPVPVSAIRVRGRLR